MLKLESKSLEAAQELKRAQTLHLMVGQACAHLSFEIFHVLRCTMSTLRDRLCLWFQEMGFSWAQSSEALKTHATLEEAVEALFASDDSPGSGTKYFSLVGSEPQAVMSWHLNLSCPFPPLQTPVPAGTNLTRQWSRKMTMSTKREIGLSYKQVVPENLRLKNQTLSRLDWSLSGRSQTPKTLQNRKSLFSCLSQLKRTPSPAVGSYFVTT